MARYKAKGKAPFIRITGADDIVSKLASLPLAVQRRVVVPALQAGASYIEGYMESAAPVDTGTMRSNIGIRPGRRRRKGRSDRFTLDVGIVASADTKRVSGGKTYFYPALVEYFDDNFMFQTFDAAGEDAGLITLGHIVAGVNDEIKARASKGSGGRKR